MRSKSEHVRQLLVSDEYSPADIADIAKCSYQLVTACRRKLRQPSENETITRRISILEQEVRDLRKKLQVLLPQA